MTWAPDVPTEEEIEGFVEDLMAVTPEILGIDETIPGCEVIDMNPYGVPAGTLPRYIKVAIREYYQDIFYRGGIPGLSVGDFVSVTHFREGNRYEVTGAGGSGGSVLTLPVPGGQGWAMTSDAVPVWIATVTPTWLGTHTWGSGFNLMPTDATGQDLGDATHRWDLHTQAVYFEGASGANVITVPDNVADALGLLDAGGLEYVRVVSTNANPYFLIDPTAAGVGVGIRTGLGTATPEGKLDVAYSGNVGIMTLLLGADVFGTTRTNNWMKTAIVGAYHYTNAEEPLGMIYAFSSNVISAVRIGGGHAYCNAATEVAIYTAANRTTLIGTNRFAVSSTGAITVTGPSLTVPAAWNLIAPDNVADALGLEDVGGLEYMRIVSTNAQPATVFNFGEVDVDFRVATLGITDALFVQGSTGFVAVGRSTPEGHLDVYDITVNTTISYYGIHNEHVKTLGATDYLDVLEGIHNHIEFDQNGATIGYLTGVNNRTILTSGFIGDGGTRDMRGIYNYLWMEDATCTVTRDVLGVYTYIDLNGGTIGDDVMGHNIYMNLRAGLTSIGGDVFGVKLYLDADQDPVGTVYSVYWEEGTNVDYGIYQNGTAPNLFGGNVILDDGVGDSPQLQFIGGSNNDTILMFLDDDAVAGDSDLVIRLCAADTGSQLTFQDNSPATVAYINAAGDAYFLRSVSVLEANPSPSTRAFNISKNNLSFTTNFNAFVLDLAKTGGVTDENDTIDAMDFSFEINQPGGVVGATRAANFAVVLTAGTVGAVATVRDMAGLKSLINLDGGTITNDAFAIECFIDQEAGNTITRNAYGMRIRADYDGTVTGTAYGLEIESRSNVDIALHVEAGATTAILVDDGHVVFNENGAPGDDFRVETNNMTHGFFVDAGLERVGINDSTPDAMLDIACRTSTEVGLIVQAAAAQSVSIVQYQDSAGNIFFDSGDGLVNSEVAWNEQGLDIDFRVEAVGQINALFVQGSDGNVGFGTATPAALEHLYSTADAGRGIIIDAKGTLTGQSAFLNFLTVGTGAVDVGNAAAQGWHFTARGNAYATAAQQNDLLIYFWDGSGWNLTQYWDHLGNVGIGVLYPAAKCHIDQASTSAAIPVLTLDQADVSDGFINFIGSDRGIITGATDSLKSVRVELGGIVYRLALYIDA